MTLELIILEGPQAGRRLPLDGTPVAFGRSPAAALSFPQDNFMSGLHMTAQGATGGVIVNDLRSTNGTFVNGERITQIVAGPGSIIKIGALTMQVVNRTAPPSGPVLSSPMIRSGAPTAVPMAAPLGSVTRTFVLPSKNSGVLDALSRVQAPLFCLLDAAADQMIPSLLALAGERKESLYDGDSASTPVSWTPYLIALPADSPLLRILVDKGWGKNWASYFTSESPFEELRTHFRKFLMVQIEQGKEVYFRFYDPRVLREFLPTANGEELALFFGPVAEWMIEAEAPGTLLKARNSLSGLEVQAVTPAARLVQPERVTDAPL